MTGTDPDPNGLVQLLVDAGFPIAGERTGIYVRFNWPHLRGNTLIVSVDETAPEHDDSMAGVLAELNNAADAGRRAQQVLDGLAGLACPDHNVPLVAQGNGHWHCSVGGCLGHIYAPEA